MGTSQPFFYVFSDEPEWCRVHLSLGKTESYFVGHNKDNDAWQDLILMSRCRHHIIANSSFSWWAAWLADQRYGVRERKVIAPTRWFAGRNDGDIDRFPAHWTLL